MYSLTKVDDVFTAFRNELDGLFADVLPNAFGSGYPRLDMEEVSDGLKVTATVPGLTKEDVSVTVNNGVVTITGKSRNKKEEKGGKHFLKEIHSSAFSRSFSVSDKFDLDKVSAKMENGLLTINIPVFPSIKQKDPVRKVEVS